MGDGGASHPDASGTTPPSNGGCACHVGGSSDRRGGGVLLFGLGLLFTLARRRRARA
jgi:MYXO-CTERM domain-containing protein